jgi:hypothetical protein
VDGLDRRVGSSGLFATCCSFDNSSGAFALQRPGSASPPKTVCIGQAGCRMSVVLCRRIISTLSSIQKPDLSLRDNKGIVFWHHHSCKIEKEEGA